MDEARRKRTRETAGGWRRDRLGSWLPILIVCCWGCTAVEKDRRAIGLQAATNGYQSALRWGYHETAIGFLHPDQRKSVEVPAALGELRVTGYDVVQPPVMQGDGSATQIVVIDYLREDTQVVKRLTDRQLWRWDETSGTWWLYSGLPSFAPAGASSKAP